MDEEAGEGANGDAPESSSSLEIIAMQVSRVLVDEHSESHALHDVMDVLKRLPFLVRHVVRIWRTSAARSGALILLQVAQDELFQDVVSALDVACVIPFVRGVDLPFPTKVALVTALASSTPVLEWLDEAYGILEADFPSHPSTLLHMTALSRSLEAHKQPMSTTHDVRLGRLVLAASRSSTASIAASPLIPASVVPAALTVLARWQHLHPMVWKLSVSKAHRVLAMSTAIFFSDVISLLWDVAGSFSLVTTAPPTSREMAMEIASFSAFSALECAQAIHAAVLACARRTKTPTLWSWHCCRPPAWVLDLTRDCVAGLPLHTSTLVALMCSIADISSALFPTNKAVASSSTRRLWDTCLDAAHSISSLMAVATVVDAMAETTPHRAQLMAYLVDVFAAILTSQSATSHARPWMALPKAAVRDFIASVSSVHVWANVFGACVARPPDDGCGWVHVLASERSALKQVVTDVLFHWVTQDTTRGFHLAVCLACDFQPIEATTAQDLSDFLVQFDRIDHLVAYLGDPLAQSLDPRRRVFVIHVVDLCAVHADAATRAELVDRVDQMGQLLAASPLISHSSALVTMFLAHLEASHLRQAYQLFAHCRRQDDLFCDNLRYSVVLAEAWKPTFSSESRFQWHFLLTCLAWWMGRPFPLPFEPVPDALVEYVAKAVPFSSLRLEMLVRRYVEGSGGQPDLRRLTQTLLTAMVDHPERRDDVVAVWRRFSKWMVVNACIEALQSTMLRTDIRQGVFLPALCPDLSFSNLFHHARLCSRLVHLAVTDATTHDDLRAFLTQVERPNYPLAAVVSIVVDYLADATDLDSWKRVLDLLWLDHSPPAAPPFGHVPRFGFIACSTTTVAQYAYSKTMGLWAKAVLPPHPSRREPKLHLDFASWVAVMAHVDVEWGRYGRQTIANVYLPLQFDGDRAKLLQEFVFAVASTDAPAMPAWLTGQLFSIPFTTQQPYSSWLCDTLHHVVMRLEDSQDLASIESSLLKVLQQLALVDRAISAMLSQDVHVASIDSWCTLWQSHPVFRSQGIAPTLVGVMAALYCRTPDEATLLRIQQCVAQDAETFRAMRQVVIDEVERTCLYVYPTECRRVRQKLERVGATKT